ncbi:MAG: carboxypeptidase-like regulatory domain-containing protein, partial [Bacteroidota bacterium]
MPNFNLLSCFRSLCLLLLGIPVSLYAQSLVTGQIFDDSTRNPVAYARVMIQGSEVGTLSNSEGQFLLRVSSELANATHLEVFCLGY